MVFESHFKITLTLNMHSMNFIISEKAIAFVLQDTKFDGIKVNKKANLSL
jgi:hypothetical protein